MPSLSDILEGIWETIRWDDPRHVKRRKPVCRECEIIASGTCLTGAAYVAHVTRMGRIMPLPGMTISIVLACAAVSLMFSFPPDENLSIRPTNKEPTTENNNKKD